MPTAYTCWFEDEGENKADRYMAISPKEAAQMHESAYHLCNINSVATYVRSAHEAKLSKWSVAEVVSYFATEIKI